MDEMITYKKWSDTEEGETSLERAITAIAEGNGTYIDDLMWEDYLGSKFCQIDSALPFYSEGNGKESNEPKT